MEEVLLKLSALPYSYCESQHIAMHLLHIARFVLLNDEMCHFAPIQKKIKKLPLDHVTIVQRA